MFRALKTWLGSLLLLAALSGLSLPRPAAAMIAPPSSESLAGAALETQAAAISVAADPAAETETLILEDADGGLWLAAYVGQNPHNGASVYVLSPDGRDPMRNTSANDTTDISFFLPSLFQTVQPSIQADNSLLHTAAFDPEDFAPDWTRRDGLWPIHDYLVTARQGGYFLNKGQYGLAGLSLLSMVAETAPLPGGKAVAAGTERVAAKTMEAAALRVMEGRAASRLASEGLTEIAMKYGRYQNGQAVDEMIAFLTGRNPVSTTALMRHPFSDGGSAIVGKATLQQLKSRGITNLGRPGEGLFISPTTEINALLTRTKNPRDIEAALGLNPGSLGDEFIRIDVPDALGRNLRLPDPSLRIGDPYHLPGTGLTTGGLQERVIDPIPMLDFGL